MEDLEPREATLSGSLLIAHPSLMDANFRHTIVLISMHSSEQGALGVVLNRPLEKTLGDFKADFASHPLSRVPLFYGGPVAQQEMILTAWQSTESPGIYKLYFGLSVEKAEMLLESDPKTDVRGFIGYSGWSSGQLEGELKENAWAVSPIDGSILQAKELGDLWRQLLKRVRPEWTILADTPENPSWN